MPQALKISIPGIVGTFIGMFKDTTLVVFVGLFDPLKAMSDTVAAPISPGKASIGSRSSLSAPSSSSSALACPVTPCIWNASSSATIAKETAMSEPHFDRKIDRSHMAVSDEVAIQITNMNKWYGQFHVLRDINMTVHRGERIVICGPQAVERR